MDCHNICLLIDRALKAWLPALWVEEIEGGAGVLGGQYLHVELRLARRAEHRVYRASLIGFKTYDLK